MTYDAVSAYTVLLGDGVGPTTVSVHGSAVDAWAALATALGAQSAPDRVDAPRRRWLPVPRPVAVVPRDGLSQDEVHDAAESWRQVDPARRFWQVTSHRLQVTVPAINTSPVVSRSA
ncbi:hypothetical protein LQ327_25440 [Actinomycetospora endophytica]|uniref:Uncharacterized protein n=1 Tax=Actinomycetospora endophytica TaxID=2291215 RepID=A0ABS8PIA5_9PSEU|nr:hypothetical protein [Actinomycetospora endophytica]MCD2196719.1 hypothetical protein [Actinomycetospora endophytica]